eukprot:TRINITY_DN138_c0_g2_i2.p1 TRINITY_DN138_c0_g2~~TRINITY_DN138_c0_g2_i2.p1  ORF type:complete len:344 (-),score=54.79 TRINITY_DN138_c0_g2_i2:455-1486(-)
MSAAEEEPACAPAAAAAEEEEPACAPAAAAAAAEVQWQWCMETADVQDLSTLSDVHWGTYAESDKIEAAYQAGNASVTTTVADMREYTVIFEGRHTDTGLCEDHSWIDTSRGHKQVNLDDPDRGKERHVRRNIVGACHPCQPVGQRTPEGECIMCLVAFKAVPNVPRKSPWKCTHVFHGACIQPWIDEKKSCPLCNTAAVNAAAAKAQTHDTRVAKRSKVNLVAAASEGNIARVDNIIKDGKVPLDTMTEHGTFALLQASVRSHRDVCEMLLEAKASVNMTTPGGMTALMVAALQGDEPIVELLLDQAADPKMKVEELGWSALDFARRGDHQQILELLEFVSK